MASSSVNTAAVAGIGSLPGVKGAMRGLAGEILADAQQGTPVDTGELRSSGRVVESGDGFQVVFDAGHSVYVHEGTQDTPAVPFLARAALKYRGSL